MQVINGNFKPNKQNPASAKLTGFYSIKSFFAGVELHTNQNDEPKNRVSPNKAQRT